MNLNGTAAIQFANARHNYPATQQIGAERATQTNSTQ